MVVLHYLRNYKKLLDAWIGFRGKLAGDIDVRFNTADADLVSEDYATNLSSGHQADKRFPIGLGE